MANQVSGKVQIGPPVPPKMLAAVLWRLLPISCRQQLWADFIERYESPQHLMRRTAKAIHGAVLEQVREPFYGSLVAGEVCTLYIALVGVLPHMLTVLLALMVPAALIVRDGYMDRKKRGYVCFLWDAVAATALLAALQFAWVPQWEAMARSAPRWVIGGVAVSFWRLIFRMPEDPCERLFDEYRDMLQLNALWIVACEALMITSLLAVPAHIPERDTFFSAAPIVLWAVAIRQRLNSIGGGLLKKAVLSPFKYPVKQDLAIKLNFLSAMLLWVCSEILFFVVMASPLAIVVWRWWTGQDGDVDWLQVDANAGALVILTAFSIKIKKLNRQTAEGLQKHIIDETETPHAAA